MTDITLMTDGGYFIYKAGAIIVHDKKVLLVKNTDFPYYYTVGGRVNYGETSEKAVAREVYEETGVHFEIDRLAMIHENFFVADFLNNTFCHEIAFYYLMKPFPNINDLSCSSITDFGAKESLYWIPVDELSAYDVYPEFYKTELLDIKNEVQHFITKNNETRRLS